MKKLIILSTLLFSLSLGSCKKYLDIEPVGKVIPATVEDYRALMTSAYNTFPRHKALLALRTDELILDEWGQDFPLVKDIYAWNDANPDGLTASFPYTSFYTTIFYTNEVISDVEARAGVSPQTAQLKGEAYLLRAYAHFELLNLFAKPYDKATAVSDKGIPVATTIDIEQQFPQLSIEQAYAQVLADIAAGQQWLNVEKWESGKNYRFDKRSALALSARVYQFRGEWNKALEATEALLSLNADLEDLNQAGSLLPNNYASKENILALEEVMDSRTSNVSMISDHLLSQYDRENDLRFGKYFSRSGGDYVSAKGNSDALKVSFRNGEIYLISAEAALRTGNRSLALERLLALKARRLKPAYYQSEQSRIGTLPENEVLTEILAERERELALEGHRWYDLRRYSRPQLVHTAGGETFTLQQNDPRYTLRFPAEARANNPNLQ
ncbi:RagB/SusD family nutrient uptake outer membrane protein [Pedobacter deserti]|uniref:RagB/SusD family nutrient uptake outer membrane protein n=1 Tax=Pedobacter deserti TaxID=2817382 RepID=UPI00210CCA78|nr:RagB/SusD family nutrient uptake outer membrane protein [Pedobacter sp. SYSU D00382]